jgi:site-specific DNA-cytosine methylase
LVKQCKPKYFLLENVIPRKQKWQNQIDYLLGIKGITINSDRFVPQNRPRMYWTNIPILELPERPNWKHHYFQYRRTHFRENKSGVCPCLTANMGTGGHNVPLYSPNLKDKLTPEDTEFLQGIPRGYSKCVSNHHRYKMIGNAFTVPVISHILNGMFYELCLPIKL